MTLILTQTLAQSIQDHGSRDYPHECCGFLIGRVEDDSLVSSVVPAGNTRMDSPRNRFEIDPGELVRVDRAARTEGLGVIGFYHSHPDAPARPSEYDREHAWPGYCYVIVSVQGGQPAQMTNWRLRDDRSGFDEDAIVGETS
jgi:proteasome lid subunit RPN8/RPN11